MRNYIQSSVWQVKVWRLITLVFLLCMRCQFRCLRAVGAADELKATVPRVAQDRCTCSGENLMKWFPLHPVSHGQASLYAEWAKPGWQMTQKSKRGTRRKSERGLRRKRKRRGRSRAGGERRGAGKGGQVNWQPFRDAFELRHINPHLIAAE